MLDLQEIFRPKTIEEALERLNQPRTFPLAGGTALVAGKLRGRHALVDLGGLNLAYIRDRAGAVVLGAMTTLADLADSPMLRAAADGIVAHAAHRSTANLLRNQATLAGTLISEPGGILAAAMVALEAEVMLARAGVAPSDRTGLNALEFLEQGGDALEGALVTEIVIPRAALSRRARLEVVARTPRDKPIVAVCASARVEADSLHSAIIALAEIGPNLQRATEAEEVLRGQGTLADFIERAADIAAGSVTPKSDFRGSAEYRRAMVRVLAVRALRGLAAGEAG